MQSRNKTVLAAHSPSSQTNRGSAADGHHAQRRYTIHVTRNEPELNQAQNSPNPDR